MTVGAGSYCPVMTTHAIAELARLAERLLDPEDWELRVNSDAICLEGRCLNAGSFDAATADAKSTLAAVLALGYVMAAACRLGAFRNEDQVAEAGVGNSTSDEVWHGSVELVLRNADA